MNFNYSENKLEKILDGYNIDDNLILMMASLLSSAAEFYEFFIELRKIRSDCKSLAEVENKRAFIHCLFVL